MYFLNKVLRKLGLWGTPYLKPSLHINRDYISKVGLPAFLKSTEETYSFVLLNLLYFIIYSSKKSDVAQHWIFAIISARNHRTTSAQTEWFARFKISLLFLVFVFVVVLLLFYGGLFYLYFNVVGHQKHFLEVFIQNIYVEEYMYSDRYIYIYICIHINVCMHLCM